jgi:hypothetical protein
MSAIGPTGYTSKLSPMIWRPYLNPWIPRLLFTLDALPGRNNIGMSWPLFYL